MNLVPPPWILELPTAARHFIVVGGELALLLFGFVLIRLALGFVAQRIAASPAFAGHQTKALAGFRVFGAVILALFVLAVLAVLAFNVSS